MNPRFISFFIIMQEGPQTLRDIKLIQTSVLYIQMYQNVLFIAIYKIDIR